MSWWFGNFIQFFILWDLDANILFIVICLCTVFGDVVEEGVWVIVRVCFDFYFEWGQLSLCVIEICLVGFGELLV